MLVTFCNNMFFQISDYPEICCECTVEDQKLLAVFKVLMLVCILDHSLVIGNEQLPQN